MARAEAQWVDETGTARVTVAMLEDISRGGVGIRLRQPLSIGTKLRIKWHKEQFDGAVRHCHREGMEYILGIQKDTPANEAQPVSDASQPESKTS